MAQRARKHQISVGVDAETFERLKQISAETGVAVGQLVRGIVKHHLPLSAQDVARYLVATGQVPGPEPEPERPAASRRRPPKRATCDGG